MLFVEGKSEGEGEEKVLIGVRGEAEPRDSRTGGGWTRDDSWAGTGHPRVHWLFLCMGVDLVYFMYD